MSNMIYVPEVQIITSLEKKNNVAKRQERG